MTAWTARTASPFGRALTAVITPMHDDGSLDLAGLQKVISHLFDTGHDGVVVSGTTGESATTSDEEQDLILRAALEVVGDRGRVVAGVGTNDTAHTVHLASRPRRPARTPSSSSPRTTTAPPSPGSSRTSPPSRTPPGCR